MDVPLGLTLAVVRQPVNLHKPDKQGSEHGRETWIRGFRIKAVYCDEFICNKKQQQSVLCTEWDIQIMLTHIRMHARYTPYIHAHMHATTPYTHISMHATTPHLVYEDLKLDVLVDLVGASDGLVQLDQCLVVVVLSVYHKDQGATPTKDVLGVKRRVKEVNLPGKVPDLEKILDTGGVSKTSTEHAQD